MTVDLMAILQTVLTAGLIGFGADHFRLRSEVAAMKSAFVTWEHMTRFEEKIDRHFELLRSELQRLGEGVAELRGQSGG
ncbi:hypothetical protein [Luteibacter sp.]|uniref:hypothetical protein n=1 Tax=Luteibacter sp. TaxID=1886636 RepID=UPI002809C674|nr:hypothetical protein [Luteibacter sp.]MDQ8050704.1 hypothetical protein [Luteibacter sp.]